jgi:hypothetical protein
VLLVFVVLEVLLFGGNTSIQMAISLAEYAFVAWVAYTDMKLGIQYLVSFSLLSIGAWSYIDPEIMPANFWGLRVFGISVNILFTLVMVAVCLLDTKRLPDLPGAAGRFLAAFIAYSFVVGIVDVLLSINYGDNFSKDLYVYLPFFAYVVLLSVMDAGSLYQIVKYGMSLTVVSMVLSRVTGIMFSYGGQTHYAPMNGFVYVAIFAVFLMRRDYSLKHYLFLTLSVMFLATSNSLFFGGKTIACCAAAILWAVLRSRKAFCMAALTVIALIALGGPILQFISGRVARDPILTYKLSQIYDLSASSSLEQMSMAPTSMGNIVAEGRTVVRYLSENRVFLLFGKGLGGGVPDIFGNLAPLAYPGAGYAYEDVGRNDFLRMHLPIFEVMLKSGLIGTLAYVVLLVRTLIVRNTFSFLSFILLATAFSNTKETILLTVLLVALSESYRYNPWQEIVKAIANSRKEGGSEICVEYMG